MNNWETDNRIGNASNHHQGAFKRVLCVCAGGLLRSPTAAWVLSQDPYNFNTRSAGVTSEYALIKVDSVLLSWADEIVCMEPYQAKKLEYLRKDVLGGKDKKIIVLNIPDQFSYRDPKLVEMIRTRYNEESGFQQHRPILTETHDE